MASSVPSACASRCPSPGLLAVLFVMAASHVVVARYDMLALDVLGSDCIFIGGDSTGVCARGRIAVPGRRALSRRERRE